MSTTLHAFRRYECENEEIRYIDDEPIDLCASTWSRCIYPILEKASEIAGCRISIPVYDIYDNADEAARGELELIDPEVFAIALTDAKVVIDNPEWIQYIDDVLLPRVQKGLYLIADRD